MTILSDLSEALGELGRELGRGAVCTDVSELDRAATATFSTSGRPLAIVRPATRADVQLCMRIARRLGVPVYPYSTGENWGYGSRVPVRNGLLLDLGRMNRIIDFSEELAYVVIEPGVTQRQLHEFLQEKRSRLWMDSTGASPDCSIIGNTMERGFGHTPMGDHCANACAFEVVLSTGDVIDTGFGQFAGSRTANVSRWGVGPSLDGLFSQSNLGIVTRMTVWLMPAPEHFEAFFFMCHDENGLGAVIDALRVLRLNGTLRGIPHIGNDYKVLSATDRFPWELTGGHTPLDASLVQRLRKERTIGAWNGSGALYGTRAQVRSARAQVKRALAGKVDRLQFVNDRLLRVMRRFATPFRLVTGWDISKTLSLLAPVYGLMKGVPTDSTLTSTYWRKRSTPQDDQDPDRDGCGLLWCSPVIPATAADAVAATRLASSTLLEFGFEPQMSISFAAERSLICVTTISYDRAVPGEDERALACYRELHERLLAHGYPPYRLNVSAMDLVTQSDSYGRLLSSLKASLDPDGVIAPGRYQPSANALLSHGSN
jgi:4-cresol dehydrogenase (hydroxylating)